jgi:hypothetical protein
MLSWIKSCNIASKQSGKKKMNPLNWRREQQLALIIAAIIGLMLGEFSGFALTSDGQRFGLWVFWYGYSSFGGFMGSIVGALIGLTTAYVARLLRQKHKQKLRETDR